MSEGRYIQMSLNELIQRQSTSELKSVHLTSLTKLDVMQLGLEYHYLIVRFITKGNKLNSERTVFHYDVLKLNETFLQVINSLSTVPS